MTEIDFSYLEKFTNFEKKPGTMRDLKLRGMKRLLADFNYPEKDIHLIHVAGSKGKGSTTAYTAAFLAELQNESVGIYGSPHVFDYRERIRSAVPGMKKIQDGFFSDECYKNELNSIRYYMENNYPDEIADTPTSFELLTLLAFLCFRRAGIKLAVIEVGLGGRLDSTNVITPLLSVITPIELEHTSYLGNSLEEVAGEKAGIIKPGIPVVTNNTERKVIDVLRRKAKECQSRLLQVADIPKSYLPHAILEGSRDEAVYLRDNAITAWVVVRMLWDERRHLFGSEADIDGLNFIEVFSRTRLPGRFEVISTRNRKTAVVNDLVMDAAHTALSVRLFIDELRRKYRTDKIPLLIFSALEDKNIPEMLKIVLHFTDRLIITTTGNFKRSNPEAIFREAQVISKQIGGKIKNIERVDSPLEALQRGFELSPSSVVAVCGSFYLLGEIHNALAVGDIRRMDES